LSDKRKRAGPAIKKHIAKAKPASGNGTGDKADEKADEKEFLDETIGRIGVLPAKAEEYLAARVKSMTTARTMRVAIAWLCVVYSITVLGALYFILIFYKLETLGIKEQYAQVALVAGSIAASTAVLLVLIKGAFTTSAEEDKHPFVPEQLKPILELMEKNKTPGA
jgi:hypothetical protein